DGARTQVGSRAEAGAAQVLVEDARERGGTFGVDQLHVRGAEAGGVGTAHHQAIEQAPLQSNLIGDGIVDVGDVVVLVPAPRDIGGEVAGDRHAELGADRVTVALAFGAA